MFKAPAAVFCLAVGICSAAFALNAVDHMASLGPNRIGILMGAMLVSFVFSLGAVLLFLSRRGDLTAAKGARHVDPGSSDETRRFGLAAGVYGLCPGERYRVIRSFKDCYGGEFTVGEEFTYVQRHYLPYHGGHTVVFRERSMYLQDQENAEVLNAFADYLAVASTLPAAAPAPALRVWEARYSTTERMYLVLLPNGVRLELAGPTLSAENWTYRQVLAGEADHSILTGFPAGQLAELKAAVAAQSSAASQS